VPVSLVVAVSGCNSTGLVIVTVTPGSIAPDSSVTFPKISPTCDCAQTDDALAAITSAAKKAVKRTLICFLRERNLRVRDTSMNGRALYMPLVPPPDDSVRNCQEWGAKPLRNNRFQGLTQGRIE
jgi:hypothetical protein